MLHLAKVSIHMSESQPFSDSLAESELDIASRLRAPKMLMVRCPQCADSPQCTVFSNFETFNCPLVWAYLYQYSFMSSLWCPRPSYIGAVF